METILAPEPTANLFSSGDQRTQVAARLILRNKKVWQITPTTWQITKTKNEQDVTWEVQECASKCRHPVSPKHRRSYPTSRSLSYKRQSGLQTMDPSPFSRIQRLYPPSQIWVKKETKKSRIYDRFHFATKVRRCSESSLICLSQIWVKKNS